MGAGLHLGVQRDALVGEEVIGGLLEGGQRLAPVQTPDVLVVPEAEKVSGLALALPVVLELVFCLGAGVVLHQHIVT